MDTVKFIQESKILLQRISAMNDKVKALLLLDTHQAKWWDVHGCEMWHHANPLVMELQDTLLYESLKLSESLNKSETERYGTMLPKELLEPGWCRKQEEIIKDIRNNPPRKVG
jgi:hypothetical protein